MPSRILDKKIEPPTYARELQVDIEPDGGEMSRQAFAPHLQQVLANVAEQLEDAFNDPQIFFKDANAGFPQRSELTGEYYVASLTYEGDDEAHQLWVMLHCLGTEGRQWGSAEPDFNFVSMEMIVYMDLATGEITYEEGFNIAAI